MNNKNNTSIPQPHQPSRSKSKTKDPQGRSQFTRYKLERQYEPKLRAFKHKLPKTTEQEKEVHERLEKQKEEQLVAGRALECFRRGEVISIDWRTRSNFRKSEMSVKLPRLRTQQIELKNQLTLNNSNSNRSNILSGQHAKSLKNKDIQQKRARLKELLYPKKTDRHYKKRPQQQYIQNQELFDENKTSIFSEGKSRSIVMVKQMIENGKMQGRSESLSGFLNEQKLVGQGGFNFAGLRSQTEEVKQLKSFQGDFVQRSERDNQLREKGSAIPSNLDSSLSLLDQGSLMDRNSISLNQQQTIQKTAAHAELNKPKQAKQSQNYDILNDPQIYLLISKSRDKLITWKESFALDSMTQIEKLKFLQEMGRKSFGHASGQGVLKERANSLDSGLVDKRVQKQRVLQQIESKKRMNSEKLSRKLTTRVLTETEQFLRQSAQSSQNHSQVYSYLGINSPQNQQHNSKQLSRPKQSRIRQKKKESLVQVQQKLLKKVKLSFLKEDLTKKFEEIRTEQK